MSIDERSRLEVMVASIHAQSRQTAEQIEGVHQDVKRINGTLADTRERVTKLEVTQESNCREIEKLRLDNEKHLEGHGNDAKAMTKWIVGIFVSVLLTMVGVVISLLRG